MTLNLGIAVAKDGPWDILSALAVILCVAAVTTVLFQRIRQPVVLGYLLAGLLVGPHVMFPVFADVHVAHMFADLGVILLMFSLGLEFSLRKLRRVVPTAGLVAVIETSLMIWLGYTIAESFGWTVRERLFTGALIAISSTTILVKAFAEQGLTGKDGRSDPRLTEIVFGILIVEDLIAILLLAILTAVASGQGLSAGDLGKTVARLGAFLGGVLLVGLLVVPRLVRAILRLGRQETTVVACVGICFASALLARQFGYSVALGAFLGGLLVAESGEAHAIEPLIEPVRDVFAAVFFVSVGMLIEPRVIMDNVWVILILTAVVICGKIVGVTMGSFIAGNGVRTSVRASMSLAQIGEFSFIIAGVGVTLGAARDFIYPVAVAISAITTLLTPWLIRYSGRAANVLDRHLPHAIQTFASLYGTWVQKLREGTRPAAEPSRNRRLATLLALDLAVIAGLVIAVSVNRQYLLNWVHPRILGNPQFARWLVAGATVGLISPFVFGAVRVAQSLGYALALQALPQDKSGMDLAAAPRRALLVTIQISILLVAGLPLLAVTQPFLPKFPWAVGLAVVVALMGIPLWRGATNLHGHVRAGAQVILEAVAAQGLAKEADKGPGTTDLQTLVPGIGDTAVFRLDAQSAAVGRTLKGLNLRGQTGASVIAVERVRAGSSPETIFPTAEDTFLESDTLVLTGPRDAVDAAKRLLQTGTV